MAIKTSKDLQRAIEAVDRRGYPGYKALRGRYDFGDFELSIDHVQGDPFAAPSKVSVWASHGRAGYPRTCFDAPYKRVAFEDYLVRRFGEALSHYSFKASGSGKSGLLATSRPGPEVPRAHGLHLRRPRHHPALRGGLPGPWALDQRPLSSSRCSATSCPAA